MDLPLEHLGIAGDFTAGEDGDNCQGDVERSAVIGTASSAREFQPRKLLAGALRCQELVGQTNDLRNGRA